MTTIFTRIIEGELPGHFVWRDDQCVAFLSINPLQPGHTLVVPIEEVDHWLDLEDEVIAHLTSVAKRVAKAQQELFNPTKVGLMIAGLEVPHVHIHVVPIRDVHDLDFANAQAQADPDELSRVAQTLRSAINDVST